MSEKNINNDSVFDWVRGLQSAFGGPFQEYKGLTERIWCGNLGGYCAYLTDVCPSTMDLAWELSRRGAFPEWSWIMAMQQKNGRGQFGRSWDSGTGNLFVTFRVPDRAAAAGPLLPLALGVLIAEELEAQSLVPEIKWPNDIFMGRKKAGGILIEQRQTCIMAGVGINVRSVPEASGDSGGYDIGACSLAQFGSLKTAPGLWNGVSRRFEQRLLEIISVPDSLKKQVDQRLAFKDEWVHLMEGNGGSSLVCINGIDRSGGLVVTASRERKIIRSGRFIPRIER